MDEKREKELFGIPVRTSECEDLTLRAGDVAFVPWPSRDKPAMNPPSVYQQVDFSDGASWSNNATCACEQAESGLSKLERVRDLLGKRHALMNHGEGRVKAIVLSKETLKRLQERVQKATPWIPALAGLCRTYYGIPLYPYDDAESKMSTVMAVMWHHRQEPGRVWLVEEGDNVSSLGMDVPAGEQSAEATEHISSVAQAVEGEGGEAESETQP